VAAGAVLAALGGFAAAALMSGAAPEPQRAVGPQVEVRTEVIRRTVHKRAPAPRRHLPPVPASTPPARPVVQTAPPPVAAAAPPVRVAAPQPAPATEGLRTRTSPVGARDDDGEAEHEVEHEVEREGEDD
jgi:hypothetical protein